ncbi:MAG: hypothetical protein WCX73_05365 [Candidatus Pacearchaeota archaeon]|jgi:hypothetical protein
MKKIVYFALGIFIIVLICSFVFDFAKWINLITFGFTIFAFIYNNWKSKKGENLEKVEKKLQIIIEQQEDKNTSKDKLKELEKERNEIEASLQEVNIKLNEEKISKEELIKDLKDDMEVVLLIKHAEGNKDEPKPIKDSLKNRGFRSVNYGMYILPPYLSPHFKETEEMNKWVTQNILKKIPEDHRYKMSIMFVDLKRVLVKEQGENHMKSIIEKLDFTDLVRLERLSHFIKKKKNISIMDIMQIPHILRLIEVGHFGYNDKKMVSENEKKIFEDISNQLGTDELKTKDISKISKEDLVKILDKYQIRNKEMIAKDIINNSKFWGQF